MPVASQVRLVYHALNNQMESFPELGKLGPMLDLLKNTGGEGMMSLMVSMLNEMSNVDFY
jgi:hypothetical protein